MATLSPPLAPHTFRGDGITQIRLPMPGSPVRYINAYLIEDDDGYTLVDCGWELPEVRKALDSALHELRIGIDRIRRVLITHFHSDHYGGAGTLVERSGAQLLMHGDEWKLLDGYLRDFPREMARRDAWLARNGFSSNILSGGRTAEFLSWFTLRAPDRELIDGQVLRVGSRRLRVVWTPGHTPGHICLYDEDLRTVFTGDHILPRVSGHLAYWDAGEPNPIKAYLESLGKIAALGAASALPAHREPIEDLQGRIDELIAGQLRFEERVVCALAEDDAWVTAAETARRMPWRKGTRFDELPKLEQCFCLGDTIAHLQHLEMQGRVVRADGGSLIRYRLAKKPVKEGAD